MKYIIQLFFILIGGSCLCFGQLKIGELNNKLIDQTINDQLSPPVSSRVFAYANLGYYMAYHLNDDSEKIKELVFNNRARQIPSGPTDLFDMDTFEVANYIFLKIAMTLAYDTTIMSAEFKNLQPKLDKNETVYGNVIYSSIAALMSSDGFKERTSLKKYEASDQLMAYQLTPPVYRLPIEPHWGTLKTFMVNKPDSFIINPTNNTFYSEDVFKKENKKLYNTSLKFKEKEQQIAYFWDCNPVHVNTIGHAKTITYRSTPAGHWLSIMTQIMDTSDIPQQKQAYIYTLSAMVMADAFIICWKNKFIVNSIRPVSYINQKIDTRWVPYLETPSFPEYPSGHSFVSSSCSYILTKIFSDKYKFTDKSQLSYGAVVRSFNSFDEAAKEAGLSRFYGGIHYKNSIRDGYKQGQMLGSHIWEQTH